MANPSPTPPEPSNAAQQDGGTWRETVSGQLERINEKGEVVEVAKKKAIQTRKDGSIRKTGAKSGRPTDESKETHHWVFDGKGRKLWVPKGTNPDNLPNIVYPFSLVTSDHILRHITEGKSVNSIGEMEGMPPCHIIYRWLREHPEFRAQMEEAKKARAQWRADQVMKIADREHIPEDEVPGQRLRKDILQWGAACDSPMEFGKQSNAGGGTGNIQIIISTGVPEPKVIEVVSEPEKGSS